MNAKPCFVCGKPAVLTHGDRFFDHELVMSRWETANAVMCPWRSRFDGMRAILEWAALDENEEGAHAECALRWAIKRENYDTRYPVTEVGL